MALILIVDDSPTEVHVMQKALEKHGFRTAAAASWLTCADTARPRRSSSASSSNGRSRSDFSSISGWAEASVMAFGPAHGESVACALATS